MNAVAALAAASLAGCTAVGGPSYELGGGDANYDALNTATKICEAAGGAVKLRGGYDSRQLSNYLCVGGKAN